MNIYFICTGNTCRSPMAEAILKNKNLQNVEVSSAGVFAQDGGELSRNAQTVLMQNDIEVDHTTSAIDAEKLAKADLILTMTLGHRQAVLQAYPAVADKTFTLKEYVDASNYDVSDPYGGSVEVYRQTFKELQQLIDALQLKILEE
ncbi:low molecular weight protein arginine phosphatase [Kurthia sibirica]|uniref:Low molecular weight protein arginine phosphatase n=1 Tax=Kurthia sibirica TaxID=202750 RepID=A0A2U3AL00_9BACL|nr:low molecular weight protein arginine phosphatase [Kurthia sibirica]PWI25172.1 low molecular weight protein arginine phosphatase [Kurthia sibirica]GEK33259.1 protein-arginine-phosphatase [Kurthia sibirica]